MSELYLDLKRRIPVVTYWTTVGTADMERAQERLGLSDEKLARSLHISTKTWSRWKRRGEIPSHELPRLAPILGFELQSSVEPIRIQAATEDDDYRAIVVELLTEILASLRRIERAGS